jgi:hypothetical protein
MLLLLMLFTTVYGCANNSRAFSASSYLNLPFSKVSLSLDNLYSAHNSTEWYLDLGYVVFTQNDTSKPVYFQSRPENLSFLQWPVSAFMNIDVVPQIPLISETSDAFAECAISDGTPMYLQVDLVDLATNFSSPFFWVSLKYGSDAIPAMMNASVPVFAGGDCYGNVSSFSALRFRAFFAEGEDVAYSCLGWAISDADFNMKYSLSAKDASVIQWDSSNETIAATVRHNIEKLQNVLIALPQFGSYAATLQLASIISPGQNVKFALGVDDETIGFPVIKHLSINPCCQGFANLLSYANNQSWSSTDYAQGIIGDQELFMVGKRPFIAYNTQVSQEVNGQCDTLTCSASGTRSIDISIEFDSLPEGLDHLYVAVVVEASSPRQINAATASASTFISSTFIALVLSSLL